MTDNDKLVKQIQEQISTTGSLVKERMRKIQIELLEELNDEHGTGFTL
jgi:hypothetical protein